VRRAAVRAAADLEFFNLVQGLKPSAEEKVDLTAFLRQL